MKVQKKCCNQCLFSKNNIVSSNKRREEIIKGAIERNTFFTCHKASIKNIEDVCCRAFWDNFKDRFNLGRIAQRLNFVEYVEID